MLSSYEGDFFVTILQMQKLKLKDTKIVLYMIELRPGSGILISIPMFSPLCPTAILRLSDSEET